MGCAMFLATPGTAAVSACMAAHEQTKILPVSARMSTIAKYPSACRHPGCDTRPLQWPCYVGRRLAAFRTRRHSPRVASGLVRSWMTSKLVTSATFVFRRGSCNATRRHRQVSVRLSSIQIELPRPRPIVAKVCCIAASMRKNAAASANDQKFTMQYRFLPATRNSEAD